MTKPKITLDTSCVISLLQLPDDSTPQVELSALEEIQRWGAGNRIEIFVSEKSRTESMQNIDRASANDPQNSARWKKWSLALKTLHTYEATEGRWILDISRFGIDTTFGSDDEGREYEEISHLLFGRPPSMLNLGDLFDLAILFEHYIQRNDLFVTRDRQNGILRNKTELNERWNITVAEPVDAETFLRNKLQTS